MHKNKRWPENCVWPEPVWDGEGVAWEEDYVDPMLLDEDGRELLEIKEYFDTLVEEKTGGSCLRLRNILTRLWKKGGSMRTTA